MFGLELWEVVYFVIFGLVAAVAVGSDEFSDHQGGES